MDSNQKVTPIEWKQYVEQQLISKGFTTRERDVIRMAFDEELHDAEYGEKPSFFHTVRPGISADELQHTMSLLRDKNSTLSKGSKLQLSDNRLNELESILHEALVNNKEHLLF